MKKFWLNCLLATLMTFLLMWGMAEVSNLKAFDAFNPIEQALSDLELTDYAFSEIRPHPDVDPRIILVNIGHLPRGAIAEQIRIISKYKPRVIGIDSYFDCEGGFRDTLNCPQLLDTLGNLLLANAIEEAGNVVLVSKLHRSQKVINAGLYNVYDSLEYSDSIFQVNAESGFANLVTNAGYQEDIKQCRSFAPRTVVDGKEQLAFSVKVAMMYDSSIARSFLERGNEEELINFRGNVELQDIKIKELRKADNATTNYPVMFFALDVDQVFREEFVPEMIRDNIVIFGFLGQYFGDPSWTDKFYTPLNKKVSGRANPDMFGLVVHANIVAMILNKDYIDQLYEWQKYFIAFVFCYLNIALFFYINSKFPVWYDSMSLIIQIAQIALLMLLTVSVFASYDFKLDLTLTLVAIAFAGPVFEFYDNVLTTLVRNWKAKRITNRREKVLTPENQDIL